MKLLLTFVVLAIGSCSASSSTNENSRAESLAIRNVREEKRDDHGKVAVQIDKVFRGDQMILITTTFLVTNKYGLHMLRGYCVEGKEVLTELIHDNGKPDVIMVYKGDFLCERFIRKADGTLEPSSSDELESLKKSQAQVVRDLKSIEADESKQKRTQK